MDTTKAHPDSADATVVGIADILVERIAVVPLNTDEALATKKAASIVVASDAALKSIGLVIRNANAGCHRILEEET